MIQALVNHPQGFIDVWAIAHATLLSTFLAFQIAIHQPNQTLAVLSGERHHFV
jgi:hypothetical protein